MEKLSLQKIKELKKLQLKKHRDAQRLIYIEGETLISELVKEFPNLIQALVVQEDKHSIFPDFTVERWLASAKELEKITQLKTPKMVNALIGYPVTKPWKKGQKAILLDQIQDPGNLGTIIRTADWFGIEHLFCAPNTTDYLNPKVIHASMASAFRVNVHYQDLAPLIEANAACTFGAYMDGQDFQTIAPEEIEFLVLGHEGHGISTALTGLIKNRIGIQPKGGAESLNVSIAAGILMQHMSK